MQGLGQVHSIRYDACIEPRDTSNAFVYRLQQCSRSMLLHRTHSRSLQWFSTPVAAVRRAGYRLKWIIGLPRTMPSKRTVRDGERFKCPYPGCKRSFAELWRLKVHYRAPPDVRGSGKERGHGQELSHCPQCGARLLPGKHHIQCSAARAKRAEVRPVLLDCADVLDQSLPAPRSPSLE